MGTELVKLAFVLIQIVYNNPSNFHPHEVMGRESETQLQMDKKINSIT